MEYKIATGVETNNNRIKTSDYEAEAYADNGEYATAWMLKRVDDTTIEVEYIRCNAGLRDSDRTEVFDVPADKSIIEFGQELADADPELAIEAAENWFDGNRV